MTADRASKECPTKGAAESQRIDPRKETTIRRLSPPFGLYWEKVEMRASVKIFSSLLDARIDQPR